MFVRLELSIDNFEVTENQSQHSRPAERNGGKFPGCVSDLSTHRSGTFDLHFGYPCSDRNTLIVITVCKKSPDANLSDR